MPAQQRRQRPSDEPTPEPTETNVDPEVLAQGETEEDGSVLVVRDADGNVVEPPQEPDEDPLEEDGPLEDDGGAQDPAAGSEDSVADLSAEPALGDQEEPDTADAEPRVKDNLLQHQAEFAATAARLDQALGGPGLAPDPEPTAPRVMCDVAQPGTINVNCDLDRGHEGDHHGTDSDGGRTWPDSSVIDVSAMPGSVETLSEPPFVQGDAVESPEPQFGAPASVTETAEVQGAALGVDPSPLRDPWTAQQQLPPSQVTSGGVHPTTEDNFTAPGQSPLQAYPANPTLDEPVFDNLQVNRLRDYLETTFPDEVNRTNVQEPESTVDVAIRLLSQYAATSSNVTRCKTSYCNKPQGHTDEHGWITYG